MKKTVLFLMATLFSTLVFADADTAPPAWGTEAEHLTPVLVEHEQFKISPVTWQEQNKIEHYNLDAIYPQVAGTELSDATKHFNDLILTMIQKQVAEFKEDVKGSASNASLPPAQSDLKINYDMTSFASQSEKTEFISVRFDVQGYARGMAHPYRNIVSFNYDLGHDKLLSLSDLFAPNSDYLSVISKASIQELEKRKLPVEQMIENGAAPKLENYQNWNLALNGLLITFGEAQVAPRYFGIQEVVLPKDVLEKIVTHQTGCTLGFINCDGT